jgi:hypothetical protein
MMNIVQGIIVTTTVMNLHLEHLEMNYSSRNFQVIIFLNLQSPLGQFSI